jgi:hypothetical protein
MYEIESLRQQLDTVSDDLSEPTRAELETLVRAREPVPERIIDAIRTKHDLHGLSFVAIAHLMNEKRVVDGMRGKGWNRAEGQGSLPGLACVTQLPREARDGLMRAWLKVLTDRHPEYTWVRVTPDAEDAKTAVQLPEPPSEREFVLAA